MKEITKEKEGVGDDKDADKNKSEDSDSDIEFVPYTKPPPVVIDLDSTETEDEEVEESSRKKSSGSNDRNAEIVPPREIIEETNKEASACEVVDLEETPPLRPASIPVPTRYASTNTPAQPMRVPNTSSQPQANTEPVPLPVPPPYPNQPMQSGYSSMEFNCFFPPAVQQGGPRGMGFPSSPVPLFSIRFPLQQSNPFPVPPPQNSIDIFPPGVPPPGPQSSYYQQQNPHPNHWVSPAPSGFSAAPTPATEAHRFRFPSCGGGITANYSNAAPSHVPSQSQNWKRVEPESANTGEVKKNRFDTENMRKKLKIQKYLNARLSAMPTFNKTLEKIFSFLPVKDQKNFRLVSKFWKESTIENWRKSVKVCLPRSNEAGTKIKSIVIVTGKSTRQTTWNRTHCSLSVFKKNVFNVPFRNFFIGEGNFSLPPVRKKSSDIHSMMDWFFYNSGPHIESLELAGVHFENKYDIVDGIRWILLNKCKKLRELSLTSFLSKEKSHGGLQRGSTFRKYQNKLARHLTSLELKPFKSNWREVDSLLSMECCRKLLEMMPNLEVLKFGMDAINLLYLLKVSTESREFIRLKTLQIKEVLLSPSNLYDLSSYVQRARPRLENLVFGADEYDIRNDLRRFDKIFDTSSVSRNLTHLSLTLKFSRNRFWITQLSGQCLPHLTHLSLKIEANKRTYDPIRLDFQFLLGFPKIQVLECFWSDVEKNGCGMVNTRLTEEKLCFSLDRGNQSGVNAKNKEVNLMEGFKGSKHMTEFHFHLNERFDKSGLVKLALWMPNLKKLAIAADWDTFSLIFTLWRNLDSLTLLPGTFGVKINDIIAEIRKYKKRICVHKMYGEDLVFDSRDYL